MEEFLNCFKPVIAMSVGLRAHILQSFGLIVLPDLLALSELLHRYFLHVSLRVKVVELDISWQLHR